MPTRLLLVFSLLCSTVFLGGCVTQAQLKSPSARTVENKINALKTNRSALIAYFKATDIPYRMGPVDMKNEICMGKFMRGAGLSRSSLAQGATVVTFSKDTFPFDKPSSLTGTPFVSGQVVYDRSGRYIGSYIVNSLTGI